MSAHIPPMRMMSFNSVALEASDNLREPTETKGDAYPRKQVFEKNGKIMWLRVIMTDGTIKADYYGDRVSAIGGKILIWVENKPNQKPNLVIGTNNQGKLQIEIANKQHIFAPDKSGCPTRHNKKRWTYSDSRKNIMLWKVRVLNAHGETLVDISTKPTLDQEIDQILIWPVEPKLKNHHRPSGKSN